MKLSIIFLILALQVSANGFSQRINFSGKNVPLEQVFIAIKKQTGYVVFYEYSVMQEAKNVTIDLKNVSLERLLEECFKGQPFSYAIEGKTILVTKKNITRVPIEKLDEKLFMIDVKGKIINKDGESVAVNITVKGTGIGTTTNDKGEFELKGIEKNAILVISGVNIETFEIKVNGRTDLGVINISTRVLMLNEISLNTGYQTLSRERSAGSFSKPNMDIVANRSTSPNILQRLEGLVPGLVVNNAPNSEGLLIRGLTSINATRTPLIIVDGVELQSTSVGNAPNGINPIAGINPQDVADISILKDATAASIWGAKASNGVIVITTKKGSNNEKIRVQYDTYYNFQNRPDLSYIPRFNSAEFIQFAKEVFPLLAPVNTWTSVKTQAPVPPHLQIQYDLYRGVISQAQADKSLDSLASINNLDQRSDLFYQNALTKNHTISLSGGGRVHSFYGSVAYTGIRSNTPGQENNSYKINLRQDFNFGSRLQFTLITDLNNTVTKGNNINNVPSGTNINSVPYQLYEDANGNPVTANYMAPRGFSDSLRLIYQARARNINLDFVPLTEINRGNSKGNLLSGRVNGKARVKLFKGLNFEGTYGYYMASSTSRIILDETSYEVRRELLDMTQAANVNTIPKYWLPTVGGRKTERNSTQKNWTVRNQFIFDQNWKTHQLTVLAGQEATSNTPVTSEVVYRGWNDQLQSSVAVNYDEAVSKVK